MSLTKYVIIRKDKYMSNVIKEDQIRRAIRESLSNEKVNNDQKLLNEFSFGKILSQVPESSVMAFKQYLVERLFDYLIQAGFPITKTSLVGRSIVNTIAAMDWMTIGKYFTSETACGEVVEAILQGVQEGFQEKGYDTIISVMFGMDGARLEGLLGSPIRELINKQFLDMTEEIRGPMVDFLCKHRDIEQLTAAIKGQLPGDKAVGEFTPMVMKK